MVDNGAITNCSTYINIQEEINPSVVTPDISQGPKNIHEIMVRCAHKSTFIHVMKTILFIALSVAVVSFYAIEMTSKFQNNASTFATKTMEADQFHMPPIIICMQNGMKPSVMEKYGLSTVFDFMFGSQLNNMSSVWDTFIEGSYLIKRDFDMKAHAITDVGMTNDIDLANGINCIETDHKNTFEVNVSQHHTQVFGTCYQIKSNISIPPPLSVSIHLIANKSGNKEDSLQVL